MINGLDKNIVFILNLMKLITALSPYKKKKHTLKYWGVKVYGTCDCSGEKKVCLEREERMGRKTIDKIKVKFSAIAMSG